jgi:hypothetical protein
MKQHSKAINNNNETNSNSEMVKNVQEKKFHQVRIYQHI